MRLIFKGGYGFKIGVIFIAILLGYGAGTVFAEDKNGNNDDEITLLEEITVTARRRAEAQQDVPIAITAFSENELEEKGIINGWDLQKAAPSLIGSQSFTRSGINYSMRGQSNNFGAVASSVVAYFADVPVSTNSAAAPFFDLENIQVLAGPQGTLFGQNSTGGAILFAPRRPTNKFEGSGSVAFGNLNYQKYEAVVNVPLGDTLAVRFAGNVTRRDGFTKDSTWNIDMDDIGEDNFRFGVLYNPTDNLENYLVWDYRHVETNHTSFQMYQLYDDALTNPDLLAAFANQQQLGIRRVQNTRTGTFAPVETSTSWGVSNTTSLDLGAVTIKNIFGYRKSLIEADNVVDGDGTLLPLLTVLPKTRLPVPGFEFPDDGDTITEELQFLGTVFDDKLEWILGGFYRHSEGGNQDRYNVGIPTPFGILPYSQDSYGSNEGDSKAVFMQGVYDLSSWVENLSVTAGFRYTEDTTKGTNGAYFTRGAEFIFAPYFPPNPCAVDGSTGLNDCFQTTKGSYSAPTWTVGLDYKVSDNILTYFVHRRGYKAGSVNVITQSQLELNPQLESMRNVDPEIVDDLEFGWKSDWSAGGMVGRFNTAIYYSKYQDIQRNGTDPVSSAPFSYNAAEASIFGVEIQTMVIPTNWLSLDMSYAYTDATYDEFTYPFPQSGLPDTLKDNPFGFVPEHKVNLSARYDTWLPKDAGNLSCSLSYSWQDEFFYTEQGTLYPDAIVPSFDLWNAIIEWSDVFGSDFTVSVFIDNVADKDYVQNGNLDAGNYGRAFYGPPRTYGLTVTYAFGK